MSASQSRALLERAASTVQKSFKEDRTVLSFQEYFAMLADAPERFCRSSAQYLLDMFDHFGKEEFTLPTGSGTRFRLFDAPFNGGDVRVAGQEEVQAAIYRCLRNFVREGRVNKLILLHGPNGSAKSSLVRCIMAGMEAYSQLDEGARYSFNWIFPASKLVGDTIGFGRQESLAVGESYAYLQAENIDARVPCEMHDHPLFLLPQGPRHELFESLFDGRDGAHADVNKVPTDNNGNDHDDLEFAVGEYLRNGDLCYKCRRIFDALLASYDGDIAKVLNHVQIERFVVSRRYRRSVATVEPQMAVDAKTQQLTADQSIGALPKALHHTSIFQPIGPLVDANRGLMEFSDFLKRPVEAFKYLLSTVETATVTMESFVLHLDMVFLASTNEKYLDAFKEHPDFPSFKGRIELVKVPYLRRYRCEREIYHDHISERTVGCHVAPHALNVAARWAVLTRMRRNDHELYGEEIGKIVDQLGPMDKLRLYDTGTTPEGLSTRLARELRHIIADLHKETLGYPNYEGRFGASAREITTVLLNAAHHEEYDCLNPLAVFDELEKLLESTSVYEFLQQEKNGEYHDHPGLLNQVREHYLDVVDREIRESMGLAAEAQYLELFSRYVLHINHWVKREKLIDPISQKPIDPDKNLMDEVEKHFLKGDEKAEDFRRSIIGAIGARALEKPDEKPVYAEIFKSHISQLREAFYASRRDELRTINENFLRFSAGEADSLEPEDQERSKSMLDNLAERYGYCKHCARDTVGYLLNNRYS